MMYRLVEAESGQILFGRLKVADNFLSRMIGLLGRSQLADDEALLIRPCNSLHTHFMRMPINVAFVDQHDRVISVQKDVRPWRFVFGKKSSAYAIEYSVNVDLLKPGICVALEKTEANVQ